MTIVTKASLAAELAISKSRVSQYVRAGLPVRSDGKLVREEAVNWITANYPERLNSRHPGVNRAAAITKTVRKKQPSAAASDENTSLQVAALLVAVSGRLAAVIAVKAGAPMQVAYALDQLVCVGLSEKAESILGLDPRSLWFEDMVDPFIVEPDWQALAAEAGETATEDEIERWGEFADRIMMQEA